MKAGIYCPYLNILGGGEKYVFDMITDITLIPDFPSKIDDNTLKKYFNLNSKEVFAIKHHTKKNYLSL